MAKLFNKRHAPAPKGAVYIGRPAMFGNPFTIGLDGSREQVIELYREYARKRVETDAGFKAAVLHLYGKDLVCWCSPLPCHGEVLMELAEELNRAEREANHG